MLVHGSKKGCNVSDWSHDNNLAVEMLSARKPSLYIFPVPGSDGQSEALASQVTGVRVSWASMLLSCRSCSLTGRPAPVPRPGEHLEIETLL